MFTSDWQNASCCSIPVTMFKSPAIYHKTHVSFAVKPVQAKWRRRLLPGHSGQGAREALSSHADARRLKGIDLPYYMNLCTHKTHTHTHTHTHICTHMHTHTHTHTRMHTHTHTHAHTHACTHTHTSHIMTMHTSIVHTVNTMHTHLFNLYLN